MNLSQLDHMDALRMESAYGFAIAIVVCPAKLLHPHLFLAKRKVVDVANPASQGTGI